MATQFEGIAQTLDKDSWEWICANHPLVADALGVEVQRGASPGDLRDFVRRYLGYHRDDFARRIEQAARYLESVKTK